MDGSEDYSEHCIQELAVIDSHHNNMQLAIGMYGTGSSTREVGGGVLE